MSLHGKRLVLLLVFGPSWVFDLLVTTHIWEASPYQLPGEAPVRGSRNSTGYYYYYYFLSSLGGMLLVVNGNVNTGDKSPPAVPVTGFALSLPKGLPLSQFGSFSTPHAIASSADGSAAYVVEIGPNKIHKFVAQGGFLLNFNVANKFFLFQDEYIILNFEF